MPFITKYGGPAKKVEAKTSAYTVTIWDNGKFFTNEGASGSVTFTLPAPAAGLAGIQYEFCTVAAQAIVIGVTGNDKLIVHGDAAADTVTTAATIGQHFTATCVGATGWFIQSDPSAATTATAVTAVTIAT